VGNRYHNFVKSIISLLHITPIIRKDDEIGHNKPSYTKSKIVSSSKPYKTLFINTPLIWKMFKGIRNKGEFEGCQVSTL
jgi:hypothetical protein